MILEYIEDLIKNIESSIFLGYHPEDSYAGDNICVLNFTGGSDPLYVFDKTLPLEENPSIQIMIRDIDYLVGYNRCVAIKNLISGVRNEEYDDNHIFLIKQRGDINPLGWDGNKRRYLFSLNFDIKIIRG